MSETQTQNNSKIVEKLKNKVNKLVEEVKKTGTPASLALMESDNWVLQLLIVPPGEVRYGATTARRQNVGILLSIRSAKLWRNSLTIASPEKFHELVALVDQFKKSDIYQPVLEMLTTREVTAVRRVVLEELEEEEESQ